MEEKIITFSANQQSLIKTGGISHYASDTVSYIKAIFDLGENWTGFDEVRAVFKTPYDTRVAVLNSLGECEVPHEILMLKAEVRVNLVGSIYTEEAVVDRLTTYSCEALEVDEDVPVDGMGTVTPSPSEYEGFVAKVKNDADRAEASATDADASAQASEQSANDSARSAQASATSAQSAHDDKIAIEEAIAEVIQQIEDFEQVQVVVNTLPPTSPATSDFTDGVLTLGIPQGVKGDTGNGIQSIRKTGTSGLVDTYTITYTDGQTTTFTVTNGAKGDTGNGISTIEKTSTVGLVDTYTITYTNGNTTTFTVSNGEKGDKGDTGEVSLSELEQATVVQTLSDTEPYNYRRTNNGNGSGHREYDEIVGASVGWNQIVNTTDTSVTIQSGHKYYSNINNVKTIGLSNGTAISINDGTKDNITDLTLFNAQIADYVYSLEQSTAGSGVTWLKTHFPKLFDNGYQPFDSGSIKSVSGLTAHEMVGKNLFDGVFEQGTFNNDGSEAYTTTRIRTGMIRVKGGATYTLSASTDNTYIHEIYTFDTLGTLVQKIIITASPSVSVTIPSGASNIRISVRYSNNGTITPNDGVKVQVELGSTATDFEPYESHTYPLDSSVTLRGQYKLDANNQLYADGDVYPSSGNVNHIMSSELDLGTLTWRLGNRNTADTGYIFYTTSLQSQIKGGTTLLIADGFVTVESMTPWERANLGDIFVVASGTVIACANYNDVASFTSAVSGKEIIFELATPTTETATPYDNPQLCDSNGTEEYVGSELPVGHNTQYPMTMVDCADGLGNGTYTPKLTVTNGKLSFEWQNV